MVTNIVNQSLPPLMSLFNTEEFKIFVIEETHKNNCKTIRLSRLLTSSASKEWLPLALEKGSDFYHRRLQSAYILEVPCHQHTIFSKSCLCFVFAIACCLVVYLPPTVSLAISSHCFPSLPLLTLLRPRLRGLCFIRDWSLWLAWPWICSSTLTSFPLPPSHH